MDLHSYFNCFMALNQITKLHYWQNGIAAANRHKQKVPNQSMHIFQLNSMKYIDIYVIIYCSLMMVTTIGFAMTMGGFRI